MKKQLNKLAKSSALVIIALAAICTTGYAQSNNDSTAGDTTITNTTLPKEEEKQVFFIVENMPEFPCGEVGLNKYLEENIVYPEEAKNKGLEGKVFIYFIVSKTGDVENIKVAKGIDPLLDNEAIRVVQNMPKWKPGSQRGKPVEVSFSLPIAFPPTNNFQTLETKPEYPGGAYALEKYISKQLAKRPKITKKKTGKYRFIINKQGYAEKVSVVRSINSAMDDMVVSALQNMSQWNCAYFRKDPNQWPVTISITADKYGRLSVSVDTMWVNR
jgi:TonB family protein